MMELIKLVAITSVWVIGLKIATAQDMIFEKLGKWGEAKVKDGHKIFEAVIVCQWCMPSIHSLVGYGFAFLLAVLPWRFDWKLVWMYPLVVMASSFVCGMSWLIYETINRIHDRNELQARYYDNMEQLTHWDIIERRERHKNTTEKKRGKT